MGLTLYEILSLLTSVVKEIKVMKEAEDIDRTNEDLAWKLLAEIEDLFEVFDD